MADAVHTQSTMPPTWHTLPVAFEINGQPWRGDVRAEETLLELVRERLRLTGTKRSCESQVCGACTVLVDGEPISACTYLVFEASGKSVTTIEGLAPEGRLDPLQEAFIRRGAAQCGFCTSGMLLACKALLEAYPKPTREQSGRYLNGNICRCGAYVQILEAIQDVVEARQSDASELPWPPQGGHTSHDTSQANQPSSDARMLRLDGHARV
jgi:aerobic carbon-monoxide dehydrogenase small subunit